MPPPHSLLSTVRLPQSTYLEKTGIIESWEVEGKALAQHPVHPALQDGRHAEPVERELGTTPRTNKYCIVSDFYFSLSGDSEGTLLSSSQVTGQVSVIHGAAQVKTFLPFYSEACSGQCSDGGEGWGRADTGPRNCYRWLCVPHAQSPCAGSQAGRQALGSSAGHRLCGSSLCDQPDQGDKRKVWKSVCPFACLGVSCWYLAVRPS